MIGESEIVVGAEIEHCLAAYIDFCLLWAFDEAFVLVETSFANSS